MTIMKRFLIALSSILLISSVLKAEERQVAFEKLPRKAQEFIHNHFPSLEVAYVKYDSDISDRDYEVRFTDGTTIEFTRNGTWKQIDCERGSEVSLEVLPEGIASYLSTAQKGVSVVEVDVDKREYEVKLSNGRELVFDRNGRFKYYDD